MRFIQLLFSTFFFAALTTCFAFDFDTKRSRNTNKNVKAIDAPIYSKP